MANPIRVREMNALRDAIEFDRVQARHRFANLKATCEARREGLSFSYWPKLPKLDPDYLRFMI